MKKFNALLLLVATALLAFGFVYTKGPKQNEKCVPGINIGNKAPDIKLNDPNGKTYSLYEVNKGKVVLIDFWASWCAPCRMENLNVVKAYNTFKNSKFKDAKGFTVFGVSLDKNVEAWKAAIAKDKLDWEYHVSDLAGWNSQPAGVYQVTGIPANFLLDANGVIVAKNVRGADLMAAIQKLEVK